MYKYFLIFVIFLICNTSKIVAQKVTRHTYTFSSFAQVQAMQNRPNIIDINNIDYAQLEALINQKINAYRRKHNLAELSITDPILHKAAQQQSNYLSNPNAYFDHKQKHHAATSTPLKRTQYYGGNYTLVAENIAKSSFLSVFMKGNKHIIPPTYSEAAAEFVDGWINSPGHKENILNKKITKMATALSFNATENELCATQVFAKD